MDKKVFWERQKRITRRFFLYIKWKIIWVLKRPKALFEKLRQRYKKHREATIMAKLFLKATKKRPGYMPVENGIMTNKKDIVKIVKWIKFWNKSKKNEHGINIDEYKKFKKKIKRR